jgi:hypothetical protein
MFELLLAPVGRCLHHKPGVMSAGVTHTVTTFISCNYFRNNTVPFCPLLSQNFSPAEVAHDCSP